MKSARLLLWLGAVALLGCGGPSRQAVGNVNSVIVIAEDSLWSAIGDSVMTVLEPRIFTVRDERTFDVTHFSPYNASWRNNRMFRQVLVIGPAAAEWVQPALARARSRDASGVVQVDNVWARNQLVTVIVAEDVAGARAQLVRAAAVIDSAFRIAAIRRMYTSKPDSALRDSLRQTQGFSILLPQVYAAVSRDPGLVLYQNSTQVGGDLVRSVLVTWRAGVIEPSADAAFAWRDSIAATAYRPGHTTQREQLRSRPITMGAARGVEVQGIWSGNDPGWPTSGLFITRMVTCSANSRTYLLDTWLFAPGPGRSKYEYVIQLNTILDTFDCSD